MEDMSQVIERSEVFKKIAVPRTNGDGPRPPSSEKPDDSDDRCELCQGRGWVSPNAPVGSPEFGTIAPCQCQESRIENERYDRLLKYSNLGGLTRFRFENLEMHGLSGSEASKNQFLKAWEAARSYAESLKGWLTFVGPNGSGKTHLAVAIANHCIENDQVVFFSHAPDLLDHLRSSFGPASEISYSDLFEQVRTVPILILDGLGGHSATPWAEEKLRQILNHRYNAELPTVVTTAVPIHELDAYIQARLNAEDFGKIVDLGFQGISQPTGLGAVPKLLSTKMTFANFETTLYDRQVESLKNALEKAKEYAQNPDIGERPWLTLAGNTGTGKTHLAVAIAVEQRKKKRPVFYISVPELLDYLRAAYSPESRVPYDRRFEKIKTSSLLILDGLGREQSSPWAMDKLRQIISYRHDRQLPTIVTTQRELNELDPMISSRIQDKDVVTLVKINARDYRAPDEGFLSRADLERRGWKPDMIERLLPKADKTAPNPHEPRGHRMQLYALARVMEAESTNELDQVISSRIQDKDDVTPVKTDARDYHAPDGRFFSRAELLLRAWTPDMIGQLLCKPDKTAPNPDPNERPVQLYAQERVLEAESTDDFEEGRARPGRR